MKNEGGWIRKMEKLKVEEDEMEEWVSEEKGCV